MTGYDWEMANILYNYVLDSNCEIIATDVNKCNYHRWLFYAYNYGY